MQSIPKSLQFLSPRWGFLEDLADAQFLDTMRELALVAIRAGASARKVCCGEGFSIVVCSEGLYSFGCNHQGQLGLGYAWATSCCNTPQRVCLDAQQVACGYMHNADASSLEVACGGHHTLVLRSHSFASPAELFAWGLNTEGQCGVGIKGEVTA